MGKKKAIYNPLAGKRASKHVASTPTQSGLKSISGAKKVKAIKGIIERSGHKRLWQQAIDNMRRDRGRPATFTTPEDLMKAAEAYFKWSDENPIEQHDIRGKDARSVYLQHVRPYSLHSMCVFIGVTTLWWTEFKQSKQVAENTNFSYAIRVIEETIRTQKFDGATVGMYNPMIISRDLGLVDKVEKDIVDNRKQVADLFPEELNDKKKK